MKNSTPSSVIHSAWILLCLCWVAKSTLVKSQPGQLIISDLTQYYFWRKPEYLPYGMTTGHGGHVGGIHKEKPPASFFSRLSEWWPKSVSSQSKAQPVEITRISSWNYPANEYSSPMDTWHSTINNYSPTSPTLSTNFRSELRTTTDKAESHNQSLTLKGYTTKKPRRRVYKPKKNNRRKGNKNKQSGHERNKLKNK